VTQRPLCKLLKYLFMDCLVTHNATALYPRSQAVAPALKPSFSAAKITSRCARRRHRAWAVAIKPRADVYALPSSKVPFGPALRTASVAV
jgi:hypothetical protein